MASTDYLYAVGRIKAQEDRILDSSSWERLISADIDDAFRILRDSGYGESAEDKENIDALINAELTEVHQLISEISPAPNLTDLFLLSTDGYNLKIILKGILLRDNTENLLREGGSIPIERMLDAVNNDAADKLPVPFAKAVEMLDKTENPQEISCAVDQAVYDVIFENLNRDKHPNVMLTNYFKSRIDFTNILTVIRSNALQWSPSKAEMLFISGGDIEYSVLKEAVGKNVDQFSDLLSVGKYSSDIRKILDDYSKSKNISSVEQAFFLRSLDIVKDSRNDIFGIGPIVNFLLQKEHEAESLRVLFASKRAKMNMTTSELGLDLSSR